MKSLPSLFIVMLLAKTAFAQDFYSSTPTFNGYVDLRAVEPSQQRTWIDGGLGKLRYGADSHQGLQFHLAAAAADANIPLTQGLTALATVRADPDQQTPFDFLEAYARYRLKIDADWMWTTKIGAFFPPISLENESIGWSSPWTLTPSAINSWVGDELRTFGAETGIEWRYKTGVIGLTGAVFGRNDPAGALLADRGWAFDDHPTGLFGRLRLPDLLAYRSQHPLPLTEWPYKEIDQLPGWYAGLTWREDGAGKLSVLRYDNRANPGADIHDIYAWHTKFTSAGIEADIEDWVILSQAMGGSTEIDPEDFAHLVTDFQSAYLLAGRYFDQWEAAARVDVFATQGNFSFVSHEHGYAASASVSWRPVSWLRLSAEELYLNSIRSQRIGAGLTPRDEESQFQLSARFFF